MVTLRRRLQREERGAAVVEFALIAPLILLLVFAIIDVGRAFYTVNQIATAVREGARAASVRGAPAGADASVIRDAMRAAAPALGATTLGDQYIEIEPDQVTRRVTVRVKAYPMPFVTPFSAVLGKTSLSITREATFHWEASP